MPKGVNLAAVCEALTTGREPSAPWSAWIAKQRGRNRMVNVERIAVMADLAATLAAAHGFAPKEYVDDAVQRTVEAAFEYPANRCPITGAEWQHALQVALDHAPFAARQKGPFGKPDPRPHLEIVTGPRSEEGGDK